MAIELDTPSAASRDGEFSLEEILFSKKRVFRY